MKALKRAGPSFIHVREERGGVSEFDNLEFRFQLGFGF
jgi:hypothetical protein